MLLLLHDEKYHDYYAKQLINNKDKLSCSLEVLSVEELLNQCTYTYDRHNKITSIKKGREKIILGDSILLNRLIRMSASNFILNDEPSKLFFKYCSSFLSQLIGSFSKASNTVGESCLSGSYHPLNMQWYLVKKNLKGITVPESDFSFGYKLNDISFLNPIVANPNDLASVANPSEQLRQKPSMHTFRFSEQKGDPYVCYFSGEYFDAKPLGENNANLSEQDLLCLSQIKNFFGLFAGEIVFFKQDGDFIFGSINHYYEKASEFADAQDIVIKGVNEFVEQRIQMEAV